MSTEVMRGLLAVVAVVLAVVSFLFLRGRRLSRAGYLLWGLLALMVPILGPFLVIVFRPGREQ